MDDESTARIKEYEVLRNEIIQMMNRQGVRMAMAFAAAAPILVFAATVRVPELGFVSAVLAASAWYDHLGHSHAIIKIGAYIRTRIEPKVPGLGWEQANARYLDGESSERKLPARLWTGLTSSYGVLVMVCLFATFSLAAAQLPAALGGMAGRGRTLRTAGFLASALASLSFIGFVALRASEHGRLRAKWKRNFERDSDLTPPATDPPSRPRRRLQTRIIGCALVLLLIASMAFFAFSIHDLMTHW